MPDPIEGIGLDDDWLDAVMLESDADERNWARRALGGISRADAMAALPKLGQITLKVPIQYWRDWKEHVTTTGMSQSRWLREAVAMKLAAERADDALVQAWWDL